MSNTSMDRTSQSISMQGSLDKQCKMRTWTWKKYWFVLKDNHLTYFKEGSRRSSVLIDLAQAHCIRNTTKGPVNGFAFEVVTKSRTHVLSSPEEENRTKWVDKLRRAMMCKRSSSSLSSSSISSASSANKHLSFSTPSCNSISDDEETMTYENALETNSSNTNCEDEVFYSIATDPTNSHSQKQKDLGKSPPKIPEPEKAVSVSAIDDPVYATPFDACANDAKVKKVIKNGAIDHDYDYISNGFEEEQDPENPYSEVQASIPPNQSTRSVQMRKSVDGSKPAVRRLVGSKQSNVADSSLSFSTDPGYADIRENVRTPSDYKTNLEPVVYTDSSGETEESERLSTLTLVAAQAGKVEDSTNSLNYQTIPDLLHPRIELTFGSSFDEIRRFIANNRGPSEMYAMPNKNHKNGTNGKAVKKLKEFLARLESKSEV